MKESYKTLKENYRKQGIYIRGSYDNECNKLILHIRKEAYNESKFSFDSIGDMQDSIHTSVSKYLENLDEYIIDIPPMKHAPMILWKQMPICDPSTLTPDEFQWYNDARMGRIQGYDMDRGYYQAVTGRNYDDMGG